MDLADIPVLPVHFPGDADAVVERSLADRLLVVLGVRLADHHVAAIALATVEVAPRGGVLLDGDNHLQEVPADGQQRIHQAEIADARVDVAAMDAEHLFEIVDGGVEIPGDEADLA